MNPDLSLVPPMVWMELKCKRPDKRDLNKRLHELVLHRPRCLYLTMYERQRYVFKPVHQPDPPWQIVGDFIPGSYVLEAFTAEEGGDSLYMWDLGGQEDFRPGEVIIPSVCTVPR